MHKGVIIGIIVAVIVIGGFLASPLFYDTEVNEPLPVALNNIEKGLTFEKFTEMDDKKRAILVEKMPEEVEIMIMEKAATMIISVSEPMDEMTSSDSSIELLKSGMFEGLAGHEAKGTAKIIQVNDVVFLRFENFQVTNGPDLRVYITSDGDVKNGIHLEKLKGNKGDQNYTLENIDVSVYNTVVIYCQPFGAYFGQAKLL